MSLKSLIGKSKYVISGVIIGSILTSGVVYAAGSDYVLSLFQAKLVFNGNEKQGSDKAFMYYNGQEYVPTSLIYNGTTYVPLRFFSESLGQQVNYEGKTETIYVGSIPETGKIATYMSDILKPYYVTNSYGFEIRNDIQIAGTKYSKGYMFLNASKTTASFNLAGKYENISGKIGLNDDANTGDATVDFYGDDKLIKTVQLTKGSLPQDFSIDVKNVIKLDINYTGGYNARVALANAMIK